MNNPSNRPTKSARGGSQNKHIHVSVKPQVTNYSLEFNAIKSQFIQGTPKGKKYIMHSPKKHSRNRAKTTQTIILFMIVS